MINFTFGVLGSVTFWCIYILLSSFTTAIFLRFLNKGTLDFLANKGTYLRTDVVWHVSTVILYLLLWPIITPIALTWLLIKEIFWPVLAKTLVTINNKIPTINFKKDIPKQSKNEDVEKQGTMETQLARAIQVLDHEIYDIIDRQRFSFFGITIAESIIHEFTDAVEKRNLVWATHRPIESKVTIIIGKTAEDIKDYIRLG